MVRWPSRRVAGDDHSLSVAVGPSILQRARSPWRCGWSLQAIDAGSAPDVVKRAGRRIALWTRLAAASLAGG